MWSKFGMSFDVTHLPCSSLIQISLSANCARFLSLLYKTPTWFDHTSCIFFRELQVSSTYTAVMSCWYIRWPQEPVCTGWRRDEDLIIVGFESQSSHCSALSRSRIIGRGLKLTVQFFYHSPGCIEISILKTLCLLTGTNFPLSAVWYKWKVTLMIWIGSIYHVVPGLATCTQSIIKYEWTLELLRVSQGFPMLQNGRV